MLITLSTRGWGVGGIMPPPPHVFFFDSVLTEAFFDPNSPQVFLKKYLRNALTITLLGYFCQNKVILTDLLEDGDNLPKYSWAPRPWEEKWSKFLA